jgi:hypothetical protein
MKILTIGKLLRETGLDLNKNIKLVRHKDHNQTHIIEGKTVEGNPYKWYLSDRKMFIAYQAQQKKEVFKNIDYIISFLGEEGTLARLIGVYRILGLDLEKMKRLNKDNNKYFYYKIEEVDGFEELNQRVIIDWGKGRNWHQGLKAGKDKEVFAIDPNDIDWYCPDYERIMLSYEQLKRIFSKQISTWKNKLSDTNCIYVISDKVSGKLYIGSTYNHDGIWGRWKDYAANGHGGDKELIKLLKTDKDYAKKNFTWAILQLLPLGINQDRAVDFETLWKNKLGREACKLNKN